LKNIVFVYNLASILLKNKIKNMIEQLIRKIFGDPSEKRVNEIAKDIAQIHESEKQFAEFNLDQIKEKTAEFKSKFE
jgi:preprotein translocase subunit SecA